MDSQWGSIVKIEDGTIQFRLPFDVVITFESIQEYDRFTTWLVECAMIMKFKAEPQGVPFEVWLAGYVDATVLEATQDVSKESKDEHEVSNSEEVSNPNQGSSE